MHKTKHYINHVVNSFKNGTKIRTPFYPVMTPENLPCLSKSRHMPIIVTLDDEPFITYPLCPDTYIDMMKVSDLGNGIKYDYIDTTTMAIRTVYFDIAGSIYRFEINQPFSNNVLEYEAEYITENDKFICIIHGVYNPNDRTIYVKANPASKLVGYTLDVFKVKTGDKS